MKPTNLQHTGNETELDNVLEDFADILFDMWLEEINVSDDAKINVNE